MRSSLTLMTLALFITVRCFSQIEPLIVDLKEECWNRIDNAINQYTDSLNFWSASNLLPNFLFDANFDHPMIGFTRDCFTKLQFISFRKAIFDRVVNEEVLVTIIASKDKRLDDCYDPKKLERIQKKTPTIHGPVYPDLPYMKYSTRELAKRRLKELRERKEQFGK